MTVIVPLLCLSLMVYSVVQSRRRLWTIFYGLLAIIGVLGLTQVLVTTLSLNGGIMAVVAVQLIFIVPAYVMRTHAVSTRSPIPKPDTAQEAVHLGDQD